MKITLNAAAAAVAAGLLTACSPPEAKEDPAVVALRAEAETRQQMLAAIATWVEAWDSGNTDGLDAITAASFQRTAPDKNAASLEELKALIGEVHRIYPDFGITNDVSAAGPDFGFVQWTVTGTDTGSAEPTGNPINITGISRYQFADGKIASELVVFDSGALMKQLGRDDIPHAGP